MSQPNPSKQLKQLTTLAQGYLQTLASPQRTALLREIGKKLQRSQKARISAQTDPDGRPWPKRRVQKGSGRVRTKMFRRLRTAKHMKLKTDDSSISLGFSGNTGKIARAHHYGLRERMQVTGGKTISIKNPTRRLIGLSTQDLADIDAHVMDHMIKAGEK
ncbi:MAG: phage virion morphogenesis protein [Parvibaculaceae bacterium]|nr:phage virion morphogenesis protein [Parvibaculaceae bacterium]